MASFIFIIAGLNLALGYLLALYLAPQLHGRCSSPAPVPVGGPPVIADEPPRQPVRSNRPSSRSTAAEATRGRASRCRSRRGCPAAASGTSGGRPPPADEPELVGELIEEFKGRSAQLSRSVGCRWTRNAQAESRGTRRGGDASLPGGSVPANARYLAQQEDSGDRLQRRLRSGRRAQADRTSIGSRLDQQIGEVRGANENLERINPQENDLLGRQKIFNETARLIDASHTLRDTLDDVELQLAGQDLARRSPCRRRSSIRPTSWSAAHGSRRPWPIAGRPIPIACNPCRWVWSIWTIAAN